MPKRLIETVIEGTRYRIRQLGGMTTAEVGERMLEAMILTQSGKPGLAAATRVARDAFMENSQVFVIDDAAGDEGPKKGAWRDMTHVFDDHFTGRTLEMGLWYNWALKESGVQDFLSGTLARGRSQPEPLPSDSPKGQAGSQTGSSSPNG